jgi:SAM-dependent methyltransferase
MPKPASLRSKIRRSYDARPYPTADEGALTKRWWRIAPLKWINALWRPECGSLFPRRILVAGCGTGSEAFNLQRRIPHAQIVAVDFSLRSIAIARQLARRAPEMRGIRFVAGDLASPGLAAKVGGDFDFISCHGVLSYIPNPERVLRNLARCLAPDGALYLGVNGAQHVSVEMRTLLPTFGFDVEELRDGRRVREVLTLFDALLGNTGRNRLSKRPASYLAGDLFGPLIHNLPLVDWQRMGRDAGLHLRGSYHAWRALRPVIETDANRLLIPRSRAEVCELVETLDPTSFHRLLFTRQPEANPPWENHEALLDWRPKLTRLYPGRLPRRSRSGQALRAITLKSAATNTRIDWRMPEWEVEILRQSNGHRSVGEIIERIRPRPTADLLQQQLYVLYQLLVLELLAPMIVPSSSVR